MKFSELDGVRNFSGICLAFLLLPENLGYLVVGL